MTAEPSWLQVIVGVACCQDAVLLQPTTVQAARAANVVYSILLYRRRLEREEMPPVSANVLF